jgi:hypothetical protein
MPTGQRAPAPRPDLDQIRGQLRDLGYLRGPLSRLEGWMVAGRGGPSSFIRLNAAASLRVAVVGGPLMGIPAVAAVALANRPHMVAPRDLILLGAWFCLALGGALGLLEFLTDLVLVWMARRGFLLAGRIERLAARTGLLFTVATTLYLAWLLRSGRRPSTEGVGAWLAWTAAIIVTLAVGRFIGRLTQLGSLLALASGAGDLPAGRTPAPGNRRRPLAIGLGLSLLAVAAGLMVFAPSGLFDPAAKIPPYFVPAPFAGRIILVGIDGLESDWYDRMKTLGACPIMTRLEREGARYDLRSDGPRVPPARWTSIATGRRREEHGILGYQADRVPGLTSPVQEDPASALTPSLRMLLPPLRRAPSPVSSGMRRALAVWEILARGGIETAAVNWWATWPADPLDGIVVSERAFARFSARLLPDRDVAPVSLQAALAERFQADLSAARSGAGLPDSRGASEGLDATSIQLDGYHGLVARRLLEAGLARVLLLYLPGLDIARARARAGDPAAPGQPESLGRVLNEADAIVGSMARLMKPEDLLLIVGDPGRQAPEAGSGGILLVWGSRVIPGWMARQVSALDIAPTLLALSGFPMARDLPGSPVLDFLHSGDLSAHLEVPIDTYGARPEASMSPSADPFDQEVLDRLRSLGYIH